MYLEGKLCEFDGVCVTKGIFCIVWLYTTISLINKLPYLVSGLVNQGLNSPCFPNSLFVSLMARIGLFLIYISLLSLQ